MPLEKGDQSQPVEDELGRVTYMGARWTRENPIVIDWSVASVKLLRDRAKGASTRRKPYFRNEDLWFREGVTWNGIASFLRCRKLSGNAIFGDKYPFISPIVEWLTVDALLALMNAPIIDFIVRTFLSSRMNVDIGDIRRVPIPVLSQKQNRRLTELGQQAIAQKLLSDNGGSSRLTEVEDEIDRSVRELYGIAHDAKLWVVR